jgi:hypothetical protein
METDFIILLAVCFLTSTIPLIKLIITIFGNSNLKFRYKIERALSDYSDNLTGVFLVSSSIGLLISFILRLIA